MPSRYYTSGKNSMSVFVDSQQRVLSRIFTGFPFHPEGGKPPETIS
ncbi:hypothetical protein M099_4438 [Phocaeicola vulgatus str. 3975 RP4]|uniref:Uncharacterized protein n=1 Tax=Phocaeicola vulgatus str. 3975 RP4 TaxID=1339352 RepID=A0A069S1E1_PHOVU|nr:hypothetical protein M099_4438 [Phocaeicola vulgatus str. 3975 RP4]